MNIINKIINDNFLSLINYSNFPSLNKVDPTSNFDKPAAEKLIVKKRSTASVILELQTKIYEVLAPLIPESGQLALVDFPHHPNIGDSAIWLGEINYLAGRHHIRPQYVCTHDNFNACELEQALPEGPIFLHGGGNFGDLWQYHHKFREHIIERYTDRKIVQLPQTIHFSDPENLRHTANLIRSHPDFTLLVRDHASLKIAQEAFDCIIEICPDMAFALGPLDKPSAHLHSLLLLMRTDKEKSSTQATVMGPLPAGAIMADWLEEDSGFPRKVKSAAIKKLLPELGADAFKKNRRRGFLYQQFAENRVARGLTLLASGETVVTDRLHGHILCTLMNHPHIVLDNFYGKLGAYIKAWTESVDCLHQDASLAFALQRYRSWNRLQA